MSFTKKKGIMTNFIILLYINFGFLCDTNKSQKLTADILKHYSELFYYYYL